jgi:uncharacterized membrane protein
VITFDASVRIGRPLEDAYAYVAEPGNFPHWNSAVEAVRKHRQATTRAWARPT